MSRVDDTKDHVPISADGGVHLRRGGRTQEYSGAWVVTYLFRCNVEHTDVDDARRAGVSAYGVEAV